MIEQLLETTESELILESPWLRRIRAAAAETARAEGEQIGRVEGLAEGEQAGRLKALRETILDVALARLEMSGPTLRQLQRAVDPVTDEARLQTLLRAAALARDVDELLTAVADV